MCAPPGYGKSTLVAQWLARPEESRPSAWISFDEGINDARALWTEIAAGLSEASGRDDPLRTMPSGNGSAQPEGDDSLQQLLTERLAQGDAPMVLVLDGFDAVRDRECLTQMARFIAGLPPRLQLVLVARAEPALPLSRLRISGELAEVRAAELAFGREATLRLVQRVSGLRLGLPEVDELLRRTEGWPAGIHLAALSLRDASDPAAVLRRFGGDDRNVVDYFTDEVMRTLSPETRGFLARTSILDRLSPPLCDAVAGTSDAAALIERLERANLFVVPLNGNRSWYRYRRLFREFLFDRLSLVESATVPMLHRRAASWHELEGDIEAAVCHMLAADDGDGALRLIIQGLPRLAPTGRPATLHGWLRDIGDDRLAAQPAAAICAARVAALNGDRHGTRHWLAVAEGFGLSSGPLPDGTRELRSAVALVRAEFGFDGVRSMLTAAETAVALEDDPASPWFAQARLLLGYARYCAGAFDLAVLPLKEAAQSQAGIPTARPLALSVLSLVEGELGRVGQSDELALVARREVDVLGLHDAAELSLAFIASGLAAARDGKAEKARAELGHALRIRWRMVGLSDWPTVHSLLALAGLELDMGDPERARVLLEQTGELLTPPADDHAHLTARLADTERRLAELTRTSRMTVEPLTEREEAVLRMLPGGLSQRDIGERLFVSINTVKSHTRAIYRKLGATSRGDAVRRARERGILK
ncbi:LuxR C-terminal-related transcriptional regulator [Spirillospora sp. NPDC047279]|uniref:LuxR C-terminal-related transcriptional regulator n=1 Tax=Spirillospora sp. NPDC047279 TaxID=3155478 RepID=UPI0033DF1791